MEPFQGSSDSSKSEILLECESHGRTCCENIGLARMRFDTGPWIKCPLRWWSVHPCSPSFWGGCQDSDYGQAAPVPCALALVPSAGESALMFNPSIPPQGLSRATRYPQAEQLLTSISHPNLPGWGSEHSQKAVRGGKKQRTIINTPYHQQPTPTPRTDIMVGG